MLNPVDRTKRKENATLQRHASQSVQETFTLPSGHVTDVHSLHDMPHCILVHNPDFNIRFPNLPAGVNPAASNTTCTCTCTRSGIVSPKRVICAARHVYHTPRTSPRRNGPTCSLENWNCTALSRVATWDDLCLLPNVDTLKSIQCSYISGEKIHSTSGLGPQMMFEVCRR